MFKQRFAQSWNDGGGIGNEGRQCKTAIQLLKDIFQLQNCQSSGTSIERPCGSWSDTSPASYAFVEG